MRGLLFRGSEVLWEATSDSPTLQGVYTRFVEIDRLPAQFASQGLAIDLTKQ